jgi:hypothetical protein
MRRSLVVTMAVCPSATMQRVTLMGGPRTRSRSQMTEKAEIGTGMLTLLVLQVLALSCQIGCRLAPFILGHAGVAHVVAVLPRSEVMCWLCASLCS